MGSCIGVELTLQFLWASSIGVGVACYGLPVCMGPTLRFHGAAMGFQYGSGTNPTIPWGCYGLPVWE